MPVVNKLQAKSKGAVKRIKVESTKQKLAYNQITGYSPVYGANQADQMISSSRYQVIDGTPRTANEVKVLAEQKRHTSVKERKRKQAALDKERVVTERGTNFYS